MADFIQIAFIVITVIANRRGLNDAAAVGIVEKFISIVFLVPSTMLSAVSALSAQNIGAGIHFSFSGYFCAYGLSGISFLHNVLSIICVRIPGAYFASPYYPDTLYPMGFAAPGGSLLSVIVCVIAFCIVGKRKDSC